VCLHKTTLFFRSFFFIDLIIWSSLKWLNAIIHKVNLTVAVAHAGCLQIGRLVVQSPVPPDQVSKCHVLTYNVYVKTHPTSSDHLFYVIIWLLYLTHGQTYNRKLIMWGSRAQLKQTFISIMVTLNSGFLLQ